MKIKSGNAMKSQEVNEVNKKCHQSWISLLKQMSHKIQLNQKYLLTKGFIIRLGSASALAHTEGTPSVEQSLRFAQLTKWMYRFHNCNFPPAGVTGRRKTIASNKLIFYYFKCIIFKENLVNRIEKPRNHAQSQPNKIEI